MRIQTYRISVGATLSNLGVALFLATTDSTQAAPPLTEVSGISVHVVWTAQPPPEVLPSGVFKIEGWEHVWYDDADDDRLDGYDIVSISARIGADGRLLQASGTFVIREKLDDYEAEDFLNGTFDPDQVQMGNILWEGVWTLTPNQDGARAVGMSADGLIAFFDFDRTANPNLNLVSIRLLEPRSE